MKAIQSGGPIQIILSAPGQSEVNRLMEVFLGAKARAYVNAIATTGDMLASSARTAEAEVAIVDAELLAGRDEGDMVEFLAQSMQDIPCIVLLPAAMANRAGTLRDIDGVHEVLIKPVNYGELLERVYSIGISERTRLGVTAPAQVYLETGSGVTAPATVAGQRIFAFAATKGGTGKTTLAANFAYRLASQGIRTLLMGFDVPDDIGAHLGLKKAPNSLDWFYRPNPDAFRAGLQLKDGHLEVLLSPNDHVEAARIARRASDEAGTIAKLVDAARNHKPPYAAIVTDVPPTEEKWTIQPLMRATDVILVLHPSLADAVKLISTIRLLTGVFDPEYRVPREAIYAVLNSVTEQDNMTGSRVQAAVREELGGYAPPVIATIPFDPQIRVLQNNHVMPVTRVDSLQRGVDMLIDFFYQNTLPTPRDGRRTSGGLLSGLGIKIKVT